MLPLFITSIHDVNPSFIAINAPTCMLFHAINDTHAFNESFYDINDGVYEAKEMRSPTHVQASVQKRKTTHTKSYMYVNQANAYAIKAYHYATTTIINAIKDNLSCNNAILCSLMSNYYASSDYFHVLRSNYYARKDNLYVSRVSLCVMRDNLYALSDDYHVTYTSIRAIKDNIYAINTNNSSLSNNNHVLKAMICALMPVFYVIKELSYAFNDNFHVINDDNYVSKELINANKELSMRAMKNRGDVTTMRDRSTTTRGGLGIGGCYLYLG